MRSNAATHDEAMTIESLLERAGAKERAKIEKHLASCDAEEGVEHGQLWRKLATMMSELTGSTVESVGGNAWRFFVPDGKYRVQVFALEDKFDGKVRVYLPDIRAEALKAKVIAKTDEDDEYEIEGTEKPMRVEALDTATTPEPPAHVKHMLGWNRKAVLIALSTTDSQSPHVDTAARLCSIAAKKWSKQAQ